jgi:hypothetical protein
MQLFKKRKCVSKKLLEEVELLAPRQGRSTNLVKFITDGHALPLRTSRISLGYLPDTMLQPEVMHWSCIGLYLISTPSPVQWLRFFPSPRRSVRHGCSRKPLYAIAPPQVQSGDHDQYRTRGLPEASTTLSVFLTVLPTNMSVTKPKYSVQSKE